MEICNYIEAERKRKQLFADILEYESANIPFMGMKLPEWVLESASRYLAWKVRRKYNKYRTHLMDKKERTGNAKDSSV